MIVTPIGCEYKCNSKRGFWRIDLYLIQCLASNTRSKWFALDFLADEFARKMPDRCTGDLESILAERLAGRRPPKDLGSSINFAAAESASLR